MAASHEQPADGAATRTSGPTSGSWTSSTSATRPTPARWTRPGGTSSPTTTRRAGSSRPAGPPRRTACRPGRRWPGRRPSAPPAGGQRPRRRPPAGQPRLRAAGRARPRPAPPAPAGPAPAPPARRRSRPPLPRPGTLPRPARRARRRGTGASQRSPADAEPRPAARRGRPHRGNMAASLTVPTATSVRVHPGQAADRQPHRDQQPPRPRPRRQGLVHPPHRLRGGPGAGRGAGDERRLRRGGRQARWSEPEHVNLGLAIDVRKRTAPGSCSCPDQGRRDDGLPPVLDGVRGRGPQGPDRQAHRRGLRRHHDQPDQPGHDRHRALGAAAGGRAGLHRRRRRDGVPGRLPGRVRGDPRPAGDQQDGHPHLDLRPPDHPGRAVRATSCA